MAESCSKTLLESTLGPLENGPSPLSESDLSRLVEDRYGIGRSEFLSNLHALEVPLSGNIILQGMATGEEITHFLKGMSADQILFIVEPSRDAWTCALERSKTWPVGERLFAFKSLGEFMDFMKSRLDLMAPESLASVHPESPAMSQLQETLLQFKQDRDLALRERLQEYHQILLRQLSQKERRWATLPTQSCRDSAFLSIATRTLDQDGQPGIDIASITPAPLQLTPLWLVDTLAREAVTDIYAVNRMRTDIAGMLPGELRWTCLMTDPVPEILEPGQSPRPDEKNRIWPLNASMRQKLAARQITASEHWFIRDRGAVRDWERRDRQILCVCDFPSDHFFDTLKRHASLAPLVEALMGALKKSPPFPTRAELELIFTLCERQSGVPLPVPSQRDWLLTLIHEHVVAPQNRRKAILDLSRHFPDVSFTVLGRGWDSVARVEAFEASDRGDVLEVLEESRFLMIPGGLENKVPDPLFYAALERGCCPMVSLPDATVRLGKLKPMEHFLSWSRFEDLDALVETMVQDPLYGRDMAQRGREILLERTLD